ncbi:hypothetical protein L3V86_01270 [Thiotrichales bacterium 19S11-10]|nr:hypothetical protein [Thiotrichales bacterium 19S11-10]
MKLTGMAEQIITNVHNICIWGSTNRESSKAGVEKYFQWKKTPHLEVPIDAGEVSGFIAALAVEKMVTENYKYCISDSKLDIAMLVSLAYRYGVANCEGMAACAYEEARKFGISNIEFVRFTPTSNSHDQEELNAIIIYKDSESVLINPWDKIACQWNNNINSIPELGQFHGHEMEVRASCKTHPTEVTEYCKSSQSVDIEREKNKFYILQKFNNIRKNNTSQHSFSSSTIICNHVESGYNSLIPELD